MQFYTQSHRFYCGVDPHTRKMYLCILNPEGDEVLHRNVKASPKAYLKAIAPFRDDLVVCCECMHCWYWLADLCYEEGIPFVLGHAYYMADRGLIEHYDRMIPELERFIEKEVKEDAVAGYYLLRSIPGIGRILSMTMLYEIHRIDRFPTCRKFASYSRLVRCQHSSNGKISGHGGRKMGSMHLKWAFSEASAYFLRGNTRGQHLLAQLEKRHGQGAALSILAHKLGRTVYYMLQRNQPFNASLFYGDSE